MKNIKKNLEIRKQITYICQTIKANKMENKEQRFGNCWKIKGSNYEVYFKEVSKTEVLKICVSGSRVFFDKIEKIDSSVFDLKSITLDEFNNKVHESIVNLEKFYTV